MLPRASRTAHLLCEFALKMDSIGLEQLDCELPMTQDQLVDVTGLTAVHVNRVLQGLAADGLIERRLPQTGSTICVYAVGQADCKEYRGPAAGVA